MKTYKVTAKLKQPVWYNSGYEFEIHAANKSEALSKARKYVLDAFDHYAKYDGSLIYSAIEI